MNYCTPYQIARITALSGSDTQSVLKIYLVMMSEGQEETKHIKIMNL